MLQDLFKLSTIPELIAYAYDLDISHQNLHLKATHMNKGDIIKINFFSLLDNYFDYIKTQSSEYVFTEEEFKQYTYQPKRLSMTLYGTMELWSLLLRVNNMSSILEFTKRTLLIPSPKLIMRILNEIIILRKSDIELNKKNLLA